MSFKWRLAQFLEVRWWKNYQRKLGGEYLEDKRNYWSKIIASSGMNLPQQKEILDVGCGPSGIYTLLEGNNVDAVDPLIEQYEENIRFFSVDKYSFVKFYPQPFEDFKADKKYDIVFCLNAINHFRDIDVSVQQLFKCLKPGGELLVGIDGHRHNFLKKLFQTIHMDLLHPVQMSLEDYKKLFKSHGFQEVKTVEYTRGNIFNYYLLKLTKA